eukprot:530714-Rhodomonas_salina.3
MQREHAAREGSVHISEVSAVALVARSLRVGASAAWRGCGGTRPEASLVGRRFFPPARESWHAKR